MNENPAADLKLTPKQKRFADELIENPAASATSAAIKAGYSEKTAYSIASENLRKPEIMLYLNNHATAAEAVLVDALQAEKDIYRFNSDIKAYEKVGTEKDHAIRIKAADSILDRVHGKAVQKSEQKSTKVVIAIDLSGKAQK